MWVHIAFFFHLDVWPGISDLPLLSLSFLICAVGLVTSLTVVNVGFGGKQAFDKQKGPITLRSPGHCGLSLYFGLRFGDTVPLRQQEGEELTWRGPGSQGTWAGAVMPQEKL